MSMQVIKRSAGRSAVAAAAYRAGERLHDERADITHDYRRRSGVDHSEILLPGNAPGWCQGIDRERLWNAVEKTEKRKDAQTARELRIMIPRELPPEERIIVVRKYLEQSFVAKGMVADVCWHNKTASDGLEQPHAHVMLTMRPLSEGGFGPKSRHDWVPDPEGRTHPDGRPIMVESNADSWNSVVYFEQCREDWEKVANAALEQAGSDQRIDRRSLLARGLARLPEPALRLAHYMKDLHGCMRERFGQFQMAKHYQAVEKRAKAAFRTAEFAAEAPPHLAAQSPKRTVRDAVTPQPGEASRLSERFFGWFDRQLERLGPSEVPMARDQSIAARASPRSPPSQEFDHDR
jgi:ATP-dependent exoDNAse (exonuclease V) alpha subunit